MLVLKEAVARPEAVQAGNRFIPLFILEKVRAQLESEELEGDDLGHP